MMRKKSVPTAIQTRQKGEVVSQTSNDTHALNVSETSKVKADQTKSSK